jgi:hypothetical protein
MRKMQDPFQQITKAKRLRDIAQEVEFKPQ